jgi:predicted transcriptional regulator
MTEATAVWISAQVPADLKEQIERIAERDERSVSWVVRQALKAHVANFGERAAA